MTDNPCQGTTENGFGDSIFDDEYGFVTHNTTGDGESVSRCWSLEFDEEIKVLQIAFYHYAITSDETCIQVVIIDRLVYNSCLFVIMLTRPCNWELHVPQTLSLFDKTVL